MSNFWGAYQVRVLTAISPSLYENLFLAIAQPKITLHTSIKRDRSMVSKKKTSKTYSCGVLQNVT